MSFHDVQFKDTSVTPTLGMYATWDFNRCLVVYIYLLESLFCQVKILVSPAIVDWLSVTQREHMQRQKHNFKSKQVDQSQKFPGYEVD